LRRLSLATRRRYNLFLEFQLFFRFLKRPKKLIGI